MTHSTALVSTVVQRIVLGMLSVALLTDIGCVSRRAYERIKAETVEHTQALETARADVQELDQQIAGLQAANRHEDTIAGELRATIQREEGQLPIMRQQAEERLSSLKTQVASLLNQSWHLARKIADIREESASLQAMATQYKHEMEQAQAQASLLVASRPTKPSVTHARPPEESSVPTVLPVEDIVTPQIAQAASPTPSLSSIPSRSVNIEPPAAASDSWISTLTGWLITFWNWLIS